MTHILLAQEQTTDKSKYKKHWKNIDKRFVKINPREKSIGSQLAKSNLCEMLKKWITRINPHTDFSP